MPGTSSDLARTVPRYFFQFVVGLLLLRCVSVVEKGKPEGLGTKRRPVSY